MTIAFDLISDLHTHTWPDFDWTGKATSSFCVVAGDVARDLTDLERILSHLTECYQAVFYIDGNEEHKNRWDDIPGNFRDIQYVVDQCPGVTYLHENVVIINGVAIMATNGWWTWDFDPSIDVPQSKEWFIDHYKANSIVPEVISHVAEIDSQYLANSVARLQRHQDVKRMVIVTHTVPHPKFVSHDVGLEGTYRMNGMGNSLMERVLNADSEGKISHWCFGHYHGSVDSTVNGIRYVNNCRGRGDTPWRQSVYHPLRIEVNF